MKSTTPAARACTWPWRRPSERPWNGCWAISAVAARACKRHDTDVRSAAVVLAGPAGSGRSSGAPAGAALRPAGGLRRIPQPSPQPGFADPPERPDLSRLHRLEGAVEFLVARTTRRSLPDRTHTHPLAHHHHPAPPRWRRRAAAPALRTVSGRTART